MKYTSKQQFTHDQVPASGVLLVNLGTPKAATATEVRRYLAEFLADPRVVELPRVLWWIVLHAVILRLRPSRVAKAYAKVWDAQGSPLLVHSQAICDKLCAKVNHLPGPVHVELAMRYGEPSIADALHRLRDKNVERLFILPLYPQYSATTTAAVFDEVTHQLRQWRWLPEFRMLMHYHDHPKYIQTLAEQIKHYQHEHGKSDKLIFSFHGIPQRYFDAGDPYFCHCQKTTRLLVEALELSEPEWMLCFQSRFGREPWLQPYLDKTLETFPAKGIKKVQIIAPGFAADCLETLEELAMQNAGIFKKQGGEALQYIPALNDHEAHIDLLLELIKQQCQGWPEVDNSTTSTQPLGRDAWAKKFSASP